MNSFHTERLQNYLFLVHNHDFTRQMIHGMVYMFIVVEGRQMANYSAAASHELAAALKCMAAVSQVEVICEGGVYTVRCKVQPEGDADVNRAVKNVETHYGTRVNFQRID